MEAGECKFSIHPLAWEDEDLGAIDLPGGPMPIRDSFGSGLARRASDPPGVIWAVGDRGPNVKPKTLVKRYGVEAMRALEQKPGAKVMPRLDLGPSLARLRVHGDRVERLEVLRLRCSTGEPATGLPPPSSDHARTEPVFDLDRRPLPPEPAGLDTEGIAALLCGEFWIGDEFGPSLVRVDGTGRILARHVPQGSAMADADASARATLPRIAARRRLNRGFEAVALSPDERLLFLAFQSPLSHPNDAAHEAARHVRVWRLDAATMEVTGQYLYALDDPASFRRDNEAGEVDRSDLKVCELVALSDEELLVLERASETTKVYRVTLSADRALAAEHLDVDHRPTVEEISAADGPLPELPKRLLFSSDAAPELPPDSEGMVVLSPTELLLVNDNDFGVEGARTRFTRIEFERPVLA